MHEVCDTWQQQWNCLDDMQWSLAYTSLGYHMTKSCKCVWHRSIIFGMWHISYAWYVVPWMICGPFTGQWPLLRDIEMIDAEGFMIILSLTNAPSCYQWLHTAYRDGIGHTVTSFTSSPEKHRTFDSFFMGMTLSLANCHCYLCDCGEADDIW